MNQFTSWEVATKDEQVAGPQHHALAERGVRQALHARSENELDPVKRAAMFIKMNDIVGPEPGVIPGVVQRPTVSALAGKLKANISGWDNNTWPICPTGTRKRDLRSVPSPGERRGWQPS